MSNAFAPVGVYLSFWQPSVEARSLQSLETMLVNDEDRQVEGTLTLALENSRGGTNGQSNKKVRDCSARSEYHLRRFQVPEHNWRFPIAGYH